STASVTLSAAMSYFSFCFVLTGDLTSTYFSDVKINKCSDDLTMFVKEKHNLFSHALWALGDITPLPDMNKNNYAAITYNKTTDYHTNGNYGLIASCDTNGKRPHVRTWYTSLSGLIGKTISFSCDVKSLEDPLIAIIYQSDGTTFRASSLQVPANTERNYVVTTTVYDTTVSLWIGVEFKNAVNENHSFYTDNWKLFLHDS
ncbi:MAG: hypothetical protein IJL02_12125, partial [Methanobrevibacter sp.]|uniref:hypothetical protein n=1 Tax=Methanobrevibacter sp. TaxID=66852 RepID=UPI0025F0325A